MHYNSHLKYYFFINLSYIINIFVFEYYVSSNDNYLILLRKKSYETTKLFKIKFTYKTDSQLHHNKHKVSKIIYDRYWNYWD